MFCGSRLPNLRSVLAAAALIALALPSQAEVEICGTPDSHGVSICSAGLPAQGVKQLAVVQEQPQWCWAASISMIFANHGYIVRQDIVKDGYGVAANLPAPSGQAMTDALSRAWVDENDRPFQGKAIASDALARKYQVTNKKVLAELAAGRPLLLGAMSHAVVLVGLRYERSQRGNVRVIGGTVIDPQQGQGIRPMLHGEMKPTYVAAVQVVGVEQKMAAAEATRDTAVLR